MSSYLSCRGLTTNQSYFHDLYCSIFQRHIHIPLGNTRFGIDLNAHHVIGMTLFDFAGEAENQTHLKYQEV